MHQSRKFSAYLANLKRRSATAQTRKTTDGRIDSASVAILYRRRREEKRSYKMGAISFFSIALLAGCGDNSPSNSDIIKQLSSQISPCPELSIVDFQKINGFPQNDGSYIDQIQYAVKFTPSEKMLGYVSNYDNEKSADVAEGVVDTARAKAIIAQTKSMKNACMATYEANLPDYNSEIGVAYKALLVAINSDNEMTEEQRPTLSGNPNSDEAIINDEISSAKSAIQEAQNMEQEKLNVDRRLEKAHQQDLIAQGVLPFGSDTQPPPGTASPGDSQAIEEANQTVATYTNYIEALTKIKPKLAAAISQYSSCQDNVKKVYQDNQGIFDHLKALNTDMANTSSKDIIALQNEMNSDCPIIIIGGVLGMFNADRDDIEAYGKTYKLAEVGNVHLIKSDNGWVIQN